MIAEALARTFERRGTAMSAGSVVLTEAFAKNADRQTAWAGYLRRERIGSLPGSFEAVMPVILDLVGPPFQAARQRSAFSERWDPIRRRWIE